MSQPSKVPATTEPAARLVGGRWQIERPLADGGMGTIYVARHVHSGKQAALKVIDRDDDEARARFRIEASVASEINHPGIADVYDADVDGETGQCFIAMELLQGETLRDTIDGGKASAAELCGLLCRSLEPLVAAQEKGYVHRDLKPDNIFVLQGSGPARHVKLLDFGIAGQQQSVGLTQTGTAMGTPHYMSPEQAMNARESTPATDVWAVGVMLYECLAGEVPFDGETAHGIIVHACTQEHRPLRELSPGIDPALSHLVDRCLSKDPGGRPRDATDLLAQLRPLLTPGSLPSTPRSPSRSPLTGPGELASGVHTRGSSSSIILPATGVATHGPLAMALLGTLIMVGTLVLALTHTLGAFEALFFGACGTLLAGLGMTLMRPAQRFRPATEHPDLPATPAAAAAPQNDNAAGDPPSRGDANAPVVIELYADLSEALSRRISDRLLALQARHADTTRLILRMAPRSEREIAWMTAEAALEVHRQAGEQGFWLFHDRLTRQKKRVTDKVIAAVAEELELNRVSLAHALKTGLHRRALTSATEALERLGAGGSPVVVINGRPVPGDLSEDCLRWALRDALKADGPRTSEAIGEMATSVSRVGDIPNEMGLRHILVRYRGARNAPRHMRRTQAQARDRAEKLRARACLPGADFGDLAMRFADDTMELGTVSLAELPGEIFEGVLNLQVDDVSATIALEDGFHVYQRVS